MCCDFWDLNTTLTGGYLSKFSEDLKYISMQHYPEQSCPGEGGEARWNISYFADHQNAVKLAQWEGTGVAIAKAAGKAVILDEYNSASCGGSPGRSNTFAAALWSIDYSLSLAINNFSAAYIHTREPPVSYNLFTAPTAGASPNSSAWTTGPQYYSLLLLTEALHSSSSSVVVDLGITPTVGYAGYAIYDSKGTSLRRLVLLNMNNASSMPFDLSGNIKGFTRTEAGAKYLSAATLNEPTEISWGGQSVDGSGTLQGTLAAHVPLSECTSGSAACQIIVPGPGAVVVSLTSAAALAFDISPKVDETAMDAID